MLISDLETYLTDKNGVISFMNRVDFINFLVEDDYFDLVISDKYEYRIDLLSIDYLGNKNLYFFISWLNNLDSFLDTVYDEILGVSDSALDTYHFELLEKPVFPQSSMLFYTIDNQLYYSLDYYSDVENFIGEFSNETDIESSVYYYNYGIIDIVFKNGRVPDDDTNIFIQYKKSVLNLRSGQVIKVPKFDAIYRYFVTVKNERGL
jgi:hypothetical protein